MCLSITTPYVIMKYAPNAADTQKMVIAGLSVQRQACKLKIPMATDAVNRPIARLMVVAWWLVSSGRRYSSLYNSALQTLAVYKLASKSIQKSLIPPGRFAGGSDWWLEAEGNGRNSRKTGANRRRSIRTIG